METGCSYNARQSGEALVDRVDCVALDLGPREPSVPSPLLGPDWLPPLQLGLPTAGPGCTSPPEGGSHPYVGSQLVPGETLPVPEAGGLWRLDRGHPGNIRLL